MKSTIWLSALSLILWASNAQAQTVTVPRTAATATSAGLEHYKITTPFPGIAPNATSSVAEYLGNLFTFSLAAIGIVATGAIVYWSIVWIFAGGNSSAVSQAKSGIWQALLGILFLFGSYVILETINPQLVRIGETERRLTTLPEVCPTRPYAGSCAEPEFTHIQDGSGADVCRSSYCVRPPEADGQPPPSPFDTASGTDGAFTGS